MPLANLADAPWLAREARIRSVNEGQAGAERYWRTWAQAKRDGCQPGLSDVAAALGELASQPAPPAWVRTELRDFVGQLDEAVRVEFGEAAHLAPAIEALLDAGVLDLDQRLVLAAQAAATSRRPPPIRMGLSRRNMSGGCSSRWPRSSAGGRPS